MPRRHGAQPGHLAQAGVLGSPAGVSSMVGRLLEQTTWRGPGRSGTGGKVRFRLEGRENDALRASHARQAGEAPQLAEIQSGTRVVPILEVLERFGGARLVAGHDAGQSV